MSQDPRLPQYFYRSIYYRSIYLSVNPLFFYIDLICHVRMTNSWVRTYIRTCLSRLMDTYTSSLKGVLEISSWHIALIRVATHISTDSYWCSVHSSGIVDRLGQLWACQPERQDRHWQRSVHQGQLWGEFMHVALSSDLDMWISTSLTAYLQGNTRHIPIHIDHAIAVVIILVKMKEDTHERDANLTQSRTHNQATWAHDYITTCQVSLDSSFPRLSDHSFPRLSDCWFSAPRPLPQAVSKQLLTSLTKRKSFYCHFCWLHQICAWILCTCVHLCTSWLLVILFV
jgi:hypothetical protein